MASKHPRLLFYFLHLLGVGHVFRAKRLIEGFSQHGIAVDIIYGGEPIAGLKFEAQNVHYLPPIKAADSTYSAYLDADGNPLEKPFLDRRTSELLNVFSSLDPDLILIEAFPFGRRMVRHELGELIKAAKSRPHPPLIVSSVRDILQERKKPGRTQETTDWINAKFDHVLVHSDPAIIRLDETFPMAGEIAAKVTYTGFVIDPSKPTKDAKSYDIIVTAGGGAFGADLMECALATATLMPHKTWCLATGPALPAGISQSLQLRAPENVTVVPRLENLAAHLSLAQVSVSQCGYNTAMDVLKANRDSACRAVFVPYDTGGQTEQLRRAELLEKAGFAINLPQSKLNPEALTKAIKSAENLKAVYLEVDFNGVENTAKSVAEWIKAR